MKDETMPTGPWKFNQEVTDAFPDMLERSIPGYYDMRESVLRIAFPFVYGGNLLDLGCSDGQMTEMFMTRAPPKTATLIDNSEPMLEKCREKFPMESVTILNHDLCKPLGIKKDTVTCALCVLTLQFIPLEQRKRVIKQVYNSLKKGGMFVVVEKLMSLDPTMDDLFRSAYHCMKHDHGYTWDQIHAKAKSLDGVLVPTTEEHNKSMLRAAGFEHVECFWRSLQFAGFIAIK